MSKQYLDSSDHVRKNRFPTETCIYTVDHPR